MGRKRLEFRRALSLRGPFKRSSKYPGALFGVDSFSRVGVLGRFDFYAEAKACSVDLVLNGKLNPIFLRMSHTFCQ